MANTEEVILKLRAQVDGAQTVQQFRQAIRDINAAMAEVPRGSAAFRELQTLLAAARDDAADFREEIDAIHPENLGNTIAKTGAIVSQGFGAMQAAAALFGEENEEIQKAIMKVQAAQQLASSLTLISEAKKQAATLKTIALKAIEAAETRAGIIATEGMTIAQRALNVVMAANPIGLIVAGIAALAAGAYVLVRAFSDTTTEAERLTKEHDKLKESTDRAIEAGKSELELLELQGAAFDVIAKKRRELAELRVKETALGLEAAKARAKEEAGQMGFMETLYAVTGNVAAAQAEQQERYIEAQKIIQEGLDAHNAALREQINENARLEQQAATAAVADAKRRAANLGGLQGELDLNKLAKEEALKNAKETGETAALIEEEYAIKEAAIRAKYADEARKKAEQQAQKMLSMKRQEQELFIKLMGDGKEKELALLELARLKELDSFTGTQTAKLLLLESYAMQRYEIEEKYRLKAEQEQKDREAKEREELNKASEDAQEDPAFLKQQQARDAALDEIVENDIRRNEIKKALLENYSSFANSIGDLFINNEKKRANFRKGQALVEIGIDTALAIASLTKNSEANPLNAITFGGAGIAQWISGIVRIAANVAKAKQMLSGGGAGGGGGATSVPAAPPPPAFSAANTQPGQGTPGFGNNTSTTLNPNGTVQQTNGTTQPIILQTQLSVSALEMTGVQQAIAQAENFSKQ